MIYLPVLANIIGIINIILKQPNKNTEFEKSSSLIQRSNLECYTSEHAKKPSGHLHFVNLLLKWNSCKQN